MPSPDVESMKRVLMQIAQLAQEFDGKSLSGLKEPAQDDESLEVGEPELGGEGTPGEEEDDKARLLAMKRHENGG